MWTNGSGVVTQKCEHTVRSRVIQNVIKGFRVRQNVIKRFRVILNVTKGFRVIQNVIKRFKVEVQRRVAQNVYKRFRVEWHKMWRNGSGAKTVESDGSGPHLNQARDSSDKCLKLDLFDCVQKKKKHLWNPTVTLCERGFSGVCTISHHSALSLAKAWT